MRDRLIELLDIIIQPGEKTMGDIADHLIKNGVIVPPCKVGDVVYMVGTYVKQIFPLEVECINYNGDDICMLCSNFTSFSVERQFGKTVFLSKEEAEKKL